MSWHTTIDTWHSLYNVSWTVCNSIHKTYMRLWSSVILWLVTLPRADWTRLTNCWIAVMTSFNWETEIRLLMSFQQTVSFCKKAKMFIACYALYKSFPFNFVALITQSTAAVFFSMCWKKCMSWWITILWFPPTRIPGWCWGRDFGFLHSFWRFGSLHTAISTTTTTTAATRTTPPPTTKEQKSWWEIIWGCKLRSGNHICFFSIRCSQCWNENASLGWNVILGIQVCGLF